MTTKKAIRSLLISLLAITTLILPSCSDYTDPDIIWDIVPITFQIELTDQTGTPLYLSTASDIYDKVSVEYEGKKYNPIDRDLIYTTYSSKSRALLAIFYGLYYFGDSYNMTPPASERIWFGEFPSDDNYTIQFRIIWPDGASSDIEYKNEFTIKHSKPNIKGTLWIDSEKQKDCNIISYKLKD